MLAGTGNGTSAPSARPRPIAARIHTGRKRSSSDNRSITAGSWVSAATEPTVSHHLKVLRQAGLVGSERQGLWAYYYVIPDALSDLGAWLT
jgi:DNA-binding transcriptional ArsR family regulator